MKNGKYRVIRAGTDLTVCLVPDSIDQINAALKAAACLGMLVKVNVPPFGVIDNAEVQRCSLDELSVAEGLWVRNIEDNRPSVEEVVAAGLNHVYRILSEYSDIGEAELASRVEQAARDYIEACFSEARTA